MLITQAPWKVFASRASRPLGQLRSLADAQALGVDRRELAGDLAHLLVNRLFVARHAEREVRLFRALERNVR
jgi:hypothetical protein